jgi:nanoRNase/pAp phosphatase (c-di-AMP/oligoRNAs hydrolase)
MVKSIIEALEGIEGPVSIHTHNTPDPDALACCLAMQWLLKKKSIEAHMFYHGEISHPMNKTMVNYLGINISRIDDYESDHFKHSIIVDATEKNSSCENPFIVIDHHKTKTKAEHSSIEEVGAASTILFEIIEELGISFDDEYDCAVATALYIGIKTDTNDLLSDNSVDRDRSASINLLPYIDKKKLQNILDYPLPAYFYELEYELQKDGNNRIEGSCWVGSVGIITKTKRDALPILAEKMLRREGIETTVVIAVVGDILDASVRSTNASLSVDQFCKKIFTKEHSGGKLGSGGTKSPLGVCSLEVDGKSLPDEVRNKMWNGIKEGLFYKILHIATGN